MFGLSEPDPKKSVIFKSSAIYTLSLMNSVDQWIHDQLYLGTNNEVAEVLFVLGSLKKFIEARWTCLAFYANEIESRVKKNMQCPFVFT